jgi:hypothetical protein
MEFQLEFFKSDDGFKNCKCTIHQSGALGFTVSAISRLGIKKEKSIKLARNLAEPESKNLYLLVSAENEEGSFKINKAGLYYYAKTKTLFDSLGINYKGKYTIIYDIVDEIDYDGLKMFKLVYREKLKRSKKE